jgi:hypothetical protein
MELILKREIKDDYCTIGRLYIDGIYFCDTLEDTDRGLSDDMSIDEIKYRKVHSKTAIPTGRYKVIPTESNYTKSHTWYQSTKLGSKMLLLYGVKCFSGILIHCGNTPSDTAGCILVGKKQGNMVVESRKTYLKLLDMLDFNNLHITIQ